MAVSFAVGHVSNVPRGIGKVGNVPHGETQHHAFQNESQSFDMKCPQAARGQEALVGFQPALAETAVPRTAPPW